jgi:hypothetical protein
MTSHTMRNSALATAAVLALYPWSVQAAEQPSAAPEAPAAAVDAQAAPAPAEAAPAAQPEAAQPASAFTAADLKIGTDVLGSDGALIGKLNRVSAGPSGAVTEIQVSTSGKVGLGAAVVTIGADKITALDGGIKLSLSAAEAKSMTAGGANG